MVKTKDNIKGIAMIFFEPRSATDRNFFSPDSGSNANLVGQEETL